MAYRRRVKAKKVVRNPKVARTHNGGEWTAARYRTFVTGALRRAAWPPKYQCIDAAFVRCGINPLTGRKCKLYLCAGCSGLFKRDQMAADHIVPVVGPEGFQTYDIFISRLYCPISGFQALCPVCHGKKTADENSGRKKFKSKSLSDTQVMIVNPSTSLQNF